METITGHVKLAGRANKNNYRAIARLPPKRVVRIIYGLQLRCFALYYPPSSSSSFSVQREWKKRRRKGRGRKERGEGKESSRVRGTNYYLVPADTPVASRNRDLTFVEMSMALFYFSFSTPLLSKDDTQLSPLFFVHHRSKSFRVAWSKAPIDLPRLEYLQIILYIPLYDESWIDFESLY